MKPSHSLSTSLTTRNQALFFLFIDNNSETFYGWFDGLASEAGLELVKGAEAVAKMPWDEEKKDLEPYNTKFGPPKLEANIAWRVYRKPD